MPAPCSAIFQRRNAREACSIRSWAVRTGEAAARAFLKQEKHPVVGEPFFRFLGKLVFDLGAEIGCSVWNVWPIRFLPSRPLIAL